jgi:hypothetical protein
MKRRLMLALLCVPAFSFGNPLQQTQTFTPRTELHPSHNPAIYRGTGSWKITDGEAGTYTVVSEAYHFSGRDGVQVQNTYQDTVTGKRWNFDFVVEHTNYGFATIWIDGVQAGRGYCFPIASHHEGDKKCHLNVITNGVRIEQSMVMKKHNLYIWGSHVLADGHNIVAWEQNLTELVETTVPGRIPH